MSLTSAHLLNGLSHLSICSDGTTSTYAYTTLKVEHEHLVSVSITSYPFLKRLLLANNAITALNVCDCTLLEHINVDYNNLASIGLGESIKSLQYASFSHNEIVHVEPDDLAAYHYIKHLNLAVNRIQTLPSLASLAYLTYLNLERNQIETLEFLHGLHQLQYLNVAHNFINDLSSLPLLSGLHVLHVQNNHISSLDELSARVPLLVELNVSHNIVHSFIPQLSQLRSLRTVLLDGNACDVSDAAQQIIYHCPTVERVDDTTVDEKMRLDIKNAMNDYDNKFSATQQYYHEQNARQQIKKFFNDKSYWALLSQRMFLKPWQAFLAQSKASIEKHIKLQQEKTLKKQDESNDDEDNAISISDDERYELNFSNLQLGEVGYWILAQLFMSLSSSSTLRGDGSRDAPSLQLCLNLANTYSQQRWSSKLAQQQFFGIDVMLRQLIPIHIVELNMSNCNISNDNIVHLCNFLKHNHTLRHLDLSNNFLGLNMISISTSNKQPDGNDDDEYAENEEKTNTSSQMNQPETVLYCPALKSLLSVLSDHPLLTHLDLSNNKIDEEGARLIGDYLCNQYLVAQAKKPMRVRIDSREGHESDNSENDEDNDNDRSSSRSSSSSSAAKPFYTQSSSLPYLPRHLGTLNLSANPLSSGMVFIAAALVKNITLHTLIIRGSGDYSIQPNNFIDLATNIAKHNKTIQVLDVSNNSRLFSLNDDSELFQNLSQAFSSLFYHDYSNIKTDFETSQNSLHTLLLANTNIHDKLLNAIMLSLKLNETLKTLDISNNPISAQGTALLFDNLSTKLHKLIAHHLLYDSKAILKLSEYLKRADNVLCLDLGDGYSYESLLKLRRSSSYTELQHHQYLSSTLDYQNHDNSYIAATPTDVSPLLNSTLISSFHYALPHTHCRTLTLPHLVENIHDVLNADELHEVETLQITHKKWSNDEWKNLEFILKKQWKFSMKYGDDDKTYGIRCLRLHHCTFDDDFNHYVNFRSFFHLLHQIQSVEVLEFDYSALNNDSLNGIGDAFDGDIATYRCMLSTLSLSHTHITQLSPSFLTWLSSHPNMMNVSLEACDLHVEQLQALISALCNNYVLKSIDLSSIQLRHSNNNNDNLLFLEQVLNYAMSHSLSYLALPNFKHNGTHATKQQLLQAIVDGWKRGVACTTTTSNDDEATNSKLHLELGKGWQEINWQLKQILMEAFQSYDASNSNSYVRVTQLTSDNISLSLTWSFKEMLTCGGDFWENALVAKLATERL